MDHTPKDLGETPKTPDMSNFKNPLSEPSGGNISIGNFTVAPLTSSEKNESVADVVKKESRDSGI